MWTKRISNLPNEVKAFINFQDLFLYINCVRKTFQIFFGALKDEILSNFYICFVIKNERSINKIQSKIKIEIRERYKNKWTIK